MHRHDPRFNGGFGSFNPFGGFPGGAYNTAWGFNAPNWNTWWNQPYSSWQGGTQGGWMTSNEGFYLISRIEEMRAQLHATTEFLRTEFARRNWTEGSTHAHGGPATGGYPYGVVPFPRNGTGFETTPVRVRESDSHIYCDVFFPQLSGGDFEIEVVGSRLVCRTRVPVAPTGRWFSTWTQWPRGFEFFELPDGRIEFTWFCPVSFQSKDVEATFRDGFLCLCVTKTEAVGPRQTVKVTKETGRRVAGELNT